MNKQFSRFFLSFLLLVSIFTVSLPQVGYAQQVGTQTQAASNLSSALAVIEQKVDARRKELGIPGMSFAIVKDGEVVFAKGFGYKDFSKQVPVTADTQFAIGSVTKAFTALSVLMSQEQGKLNLDDSPKKYLPYFKISNADIDSRITIRDLLAHSSGLNRTDLAMITGKLTREELIKVAGEAKPTVGLREKFQYQNIMYTAAGEIVSQVQKQSWESFVEDKIFKSLGMTNSTMSVAQMQKAKDYSFGYDYNFDTKETRLLPTRDILQVAPAGSINSSAKDMSQWLKFMLAGGEINGKRLVSENIFAEMIKPQMKISPDGKFSYGLGWFLQEWKGLRVVQHGGNIDGFNSLVAMIPEKKIGFVMLTNVTGSSLGSDLMPIVWENLLNESKPAIEGGGNVVQIQETGKYRVEGTEFEIEVKKENGKLVAIAPGQPVYTLEVVSGKRYKLAGAPDGFFITFREKDAFLEQPQGNYTLTRLAPDVKTQAASNPDAVKELIGKYQLPSGNMTIEIKEVEGKVSLVVGTQPPYALKEKEKDVYNTPPLPDTYFVKVKRNGEGKVQAITLVQPQGESSFNRVDAATADTKPALSADEIMSKTIVALGGEANWKKLTTRQMKVEIDFIHQGVKGYGSIFQKTPNLSASESTFTALGKPIATEFSYFDGTSAGEVLSFMPAETFTGKRLEDIRLENDFYGILNWKSNLKSAEVKGVEKVGDEDVYVIVFHPEKASDYALFISTKTFLPVKRNGVIVSSTSNIKLPVSQIFSDYRAIDGIMLPFQTTSKSPSMGDVVTVVKEVKHNVEIADSMFKPKK